MKDLVSQGLAVVNSDNGFKFKDGLLVLEGVAKKNGYDVHVIIREALKNSKFREALNLADKNRDNKIDAKEADSLDLILSR